MVLDQISPLASTSSVKYKIREGRREKSEILTSTSYKKQLEKEAKSAEKKAIKESKLSKKEVAEQKIKKKKKNVNLWFSAALVILIYNIELCGTCITHYGCKINNTTLFCNKHLDLTKGSEDIRTLEICHVNKTELVLSVILQNFPNLNSLIIKYSSFKKISAKHLKENYTDLEEIVFNNVSITSIDENIFNKFKGLKVLDLRNNSLQFINNETIHHLLDHISTIYLSGNKWNCSKNLDWVHHLNETIVPDFENLTCYGEPFPGKPLDFVTNVIRRANFECPPTCKCNLINVFRNSEIEELQAVVEVDCSRRNLTDLPESLPKYARILKVQRNLIDDLSPLIKNPIYRDVTDLYIDYNLIRTIDLLEGTFWLRNFRVLSLRGNQLSELPTYAMDNALQVNPNMPNAIMLYLGNNPWRCDCIFTPSFQIVDLSRSSICQLPSEYSIRALDLLNGVLASLIVLVLGKLAYDYYYFKKTGKLPWIVTKMP
ncbi:ig(immunoglobulin) and lrr(leucine rich repeat) domain [Holotrichia oblita]|uniref:Ig(Immunoglobulin) and lrr(Leucine rich repeat) domain n=1 Tax=Holotrichia oblita TaxID=644536 RepID=A0ACB9SPL4_HOLOL|nr:ig(immunoglobulin) and lrr(leucine rich repeat) domain [Holotrichia oblita]